MLRIDILTLFPGMLEGFLTESIIKIAREKGLCEIHLHDFREHANNRWGKVDDRPYGGGPGMVIQCAPVFGAVEALEAKVGSGSGSGEGAVRRILLTPQGRRLTQPILEELAQSQRIVLLCGRYEGFDERIREGLGFEELSIGDYVLSGGEPAAVVVIDGVVRLLEGALGDADSVKEESFSELGLEYPHYTRPPEFRGMRVPEVLLSGNHEEIARWRREQARTRTRARRPDLLCMDDHHEADGESGKWTRSS